MGTHSCIARRVAPNVIQFGNIINDGYLEYVGRVLIEYYNSAERVEKLFSLGQLETLGAPGTEDIQFPFILQSTGTFCTRVTNGYCPHEICKSETEIDPPVMFTDYYYFYDSDGVWYYVKPGKIMQKIPLEYAIGRMKFFQKNPGLDPKGDPDWSVSFEMEMAFFKEIFFEYPKTDPEFKELLDSMEINLDETFASLNKIVFPFEKISGKIGKLVSYFDNWSVCGVSSEDKPPVKVFVKKASEKHVETYLWDIPKALLQRPSL